ncbi:MAG: type II CAAX endopeptidase family protein [Kiritimatiellia bacterium]|jgi:membrane protease YdiL (CAAX protease family)|nr:type II CAAX endopeptidase family protein [Kiritimatiellia bacterium]MDP6811505.1 type II CAAX endopeptidase family protein [Kiritimatiellia bacterium]MDP7023765.1 type II CAAX endopeptidase family protein [Kiritimatiellia bacterium]
MDSIFQTVDPHELPLVIQLIGSLMVFAIIAGIGIDILLVILMRIRPPSFPGYAKRMQSRPWSWRDVGFLVSSVVLGFLCAQVVAEILFAVGAEAAGTCIMQLHTLFFQVLAIGIIIYLLRHHGVSWRRAFGLGHGHVLLRIGQGIVFYLAAMPVVLFYGLASMMLFHALGLPFERQPAVDFMLDPNQSLGLQLYLVVLAVVGAPLIEEALFRGIAFPAMLRHTTLTRAMVFVSLIFAAIHLTPTAVIPLFVFAMALSLAYLYTGNIIVPIVMHLLFNSVSIGMLFVIRTFAPELIH